MQLGMYCSRHLSYEGATFDIIEHSLTPKEKAMYDEAARYYCHTKTFDWIAPHTCFFLQILA